jgi:hypothetical protein
MPTHETNPQTTRWLKAVMIVVAIGCVMWLWHHEAHRNDKPIVTGKSATNANATAIALAAKAAYSESKLQEFTARLNAAPDAKTARPHLAELRGTLAGMSTNAAVAEIRRFLDSKADGPTQLEFKVAGNGLLDEAPTVRTFLLDELARMDPAAAADYAKVILASKDSPDEWAVALRNLARGDASVAGRELLAQKVGELLRHEPWQREPSVGYLEAFDVPVFLGGTNLLPVLSGLIRREDNPAVARASFLALDRLVINDAAATLAVLQTAPDLMQGREQARANYFARVDVRSPGQRQILESYLVNPSISPAELAAFAGVFPNANFMVSPNLLTQSATADRTTLMARDAESLRVVGLWLADPRFARLHPQLEKMRARLELFVQQAEQAR